MTTDSDADLLAGLVRDNRRLRRLLNQQNASSELRHRLRNTLALLRAVIRESAHTERDLSSYVDHLGDRLDAISRAQAQVDQYGEVSLRTLLLEELIRYGKHEDDTLVLSGPDFRLHPSSGQIVGLALHELAINAVEYGALGHNGGRVEVEWQVADMDRGPGLTLVWREFGGTISTDPACRGFGTKVLTHILAYNLSAETAITFGPGEFNCTIKLPLNEHLGRLATE